VGAGMIDNRVAVLEGRREDADFVIRANENWSDSFREDPDSFKRIVRMETRIETLFRKYFREAPERFDRYIDWAEYERRLVLAASAGKGKTVKAARIWSEPMIEAVDDELGIMFALTFDDIGKTIMVGATAAEKVYKIPTDLNPYSKAISVGARQHTAKLVKDVHQTTKDRISQAIENSIAKGEKLEEAKRRVADAINDTARAERIARTESVNAWTEGQLIYAKETGAETKEWELSFDPCELCLVAGSGDPIPLNQDFPGDGGNGPALHPNCRCGIKFNYPKTGE
jgi:hypothetical protein